ncbi:MAG: hypothetical protein R6V04_15155 [bacterium]
MNRKYVSFTMIMTILSSLSIYIPDSKAQEPTNTYIRRPYGVLARENADYQPVHDPPVEPFDWYRNSRYTIGVLGGPEETLVTAEGYLRTDFGTLKFYTGNELTPLKKRIKTLKKDYMPVVEMKIKENNITYLFEYFADVVDGVAKIPYSHTYGVPSRTIDTEIDNLISFAKIEIVNESADPQEIIFSVGLGPENIGEPSKQGPGTVVFDPEKNTLIGQTHSLYSVSVSPDTVIGRWKSDEGVLQYRLSLASHQKQTLIIKIPYFTAQLKDSERIQAADYEQHLKKTIKFWDDFLAERTTRIQIPEEKVENAYKANLIFSLIGCLDIVEGLYFYHANPTIYDRFWLRDSAINVRGLDLAGCNDIVEKVLYTYLDWQKEDGEFVGRHPNQWDGHGQALWALGHHYLVTEDKDYARKVSPSVLKAMEWQWEFRKQAWEEAEGLLPYLYMGDNEGVKGHLVGYNLWAISGAKGAVWLAKGLGKNKTAEQWKQRYKEYENILKQKCKIVFNELGVIPPTLEGLQAPAIRTGWYGDVYGIDWGNLIPVYPSGVFDPWDTMVTASLKEWRKKTFEGIFSYPMGGVESLIHSYTPLFISETYVIRGQQLEAVKDLYSHLVHTSATHMASEGMNAAGRWGWSPVTETMPHGEFSGKYLSFLRDMLILEWNGNVHVGKALSPAWMEPGSVIEFSGITYFGDTDISLKMLRNGMKARIHPPLRSFSGNIILHIPDNYSVSEVRRNGKIWDNIQDNTIIFPPGENRFSVEVAWEKTESAPPLSFQRAVKDYQSNYAKMVQDPDLQLVGPLKISKKKIKADERFTVSAVIKNKGGAGYPQEDICLYINGYPVQSEPRELSRGIGFNSPSDIISFNRNEEGTVQISFTLTYAPGEHTVTIGLGDTLLPSQTIRILE